MVNWILECCFKRKAPHLPWSMSFPLGRRPDLAEYLSDEERLVQISRLTDIFSEINKLNTMMQNARENDIVQNECIS